jgi:hypothetical protein
MRSEAKKFGTAWVAACRATFCIRRGTSRGSGRKILTRALASLGAVVLLAGCGSTMAAPTTPTKHLGMPPLSWTSER